MRLTKWICIIVLILFQSISSAQPGESLLFNHFSEERNLPLFSYSSILQDKKGYMWFGTDWHGLIKYDGYSFKFFNQDPFNKNSLGTPGARSLYNDIHGNIWIAGEGGVSKYDPHKENFIPYWYDWYGPQHKLEISHQSEYIAALPTTTITCVIGDERGRVWIGTANGLCFLDSPSAKVVNLSDIILPDTLCNLNIRCLMIDHTGLLWIGTEKGINIYDRVNKTIKLFIPGDKRYAAMSKGISSMLEDHSGNIWISLENKGILRYDPSWVVSKPYRHSATNSPSLSSDNVRTLIEDSHHTIWAGTSRGISIYQPGKDNFTACNDANDKSSLRTNQVENLFEDRSGALWIAARDKGIDRYYSTGKKFSFYPYRHKEEPYHSTTGIYKDAAGKIYMTTLGSGVQEFNPVTGTFKSFEVLPNRGLTALNNYFGAYEDSEGNFWLMGLKEGLHKLDRKTGKFTAVYSHGDNVSTCMAEDPDKRLWIGTNGGLRCYDLKTKTYSTAEKLYPATPELEFAHSFGDLYCDKDGILWIGGNGGLVLLNTKTGKAKSFVQDPENINSLSSNQINCFYHDGKGGVWIGTNWGLNRFDKKTEQFIWYTVKDGLPDNNVTGIVTDENGNLWLSTEKGICKFTPPSSENKKAVCRIYDISDGLPSIGFGHALKGNDGTFYFSCNAGIVAFKPDELKDNQYVPPVLITDFSVFNKSVVHQDSTGILELPADETKEIKLSYKQNVIGFTFTALNYIHPEKNRYAYKLEEFDKDWTYTDATKRFANYTNLNPGEYIFKVKASNNDGIWNEEGASIKLIITPPYWQTAWFKLLCVFAGGILLYAIWYSRMQKLRDIYRIRNKIAGDLHDDLGATLSSISIMSELANQQIKDQSPQASSLLEKIGSSSRNMIESVNDMVWAINPQNDSFENIIKRMRTFASEILAAKDIAFHFDFDKNLLESKMKIEMRRNFYLIFKEAVNNVAKYSGASNAFIMIRKPENNLVMIIRDDGCGFNPDSVKKGNGLTNMQKRAEEMKAFFNFKSISGKGTTIELEFKNE